MKMDIFGSTGEEAMWCTSGVWPWLEHGQVMKAHV